MLEKYFNLLSPSSILFHLIPLALFIWRVQKRRKDRIISTVEDSAEVLEYATNRFQNKYKEILPECILENSIVFEHQVAGHTNEIIRSYANFILKPMIKPRNFIKEVMFYENALLSGTSSTLSPAAFLPKYHGVVSLKENGKITSYIVLEDILKDFKLPCVMDLKIGKQTFEPNATEEKKIRNIKKYIYQDVVGFRVTGFKCYSKRDKSYLIEGKHFGRSLTPENVKMGLHKFFFDGETLRSDVIKIVLQKLDPLWRWACRQNRYQFYCSSVLIAYDAEALESQRNKENFVQVKIIDFAHTFINQSSSSSYSFVPSFDEGYAFGLRSLIEHLESLL